jgi:hypothetical protein
VCHKISYMTHGHKHCNSILFILSLVHLQCSFFDVILVTPFSIKKHKQCTVLERDTTCHHPWNIYQLILVHLKVYIYIYIYCFFFLLINHDGCVCMHADRQMCFQFIHNNPPTHACVYVCVYVYMFCANSLYLCMIYTHFCLL